MSHVDLVPRQNSVENEAKLRQAALVDEGREVGISMAYYLSSWILQCLKLDYPLGDFFKCPFYLSLR